MRLGEQKPKCLIHVGGRSLIMHSVAAFEEADRVKSIILVVPEKSTKNVTDEIEQHGFKKVHDVVAGGTERQDSVFEGLKKLPSDSEYTLIHDGARPYIKTHEINKLCDSLRNEPSAFLAHGLSETLHINKEGYADKAPHRSTIVAAETPQGFRTKILKKAFESAVMRNIKHTDEISLLREELGIKSKVVLNESANHKITTADDMRVFKIFQASEY